jgi:transposase
MGVPRNVYGERRCLNGVLLGRPEGKRPIGRPIVDDRILLKWIFKKGIRAIEWIDLAQYSDRWRSVLL